MAKAQKAVKGVGRRASKKRVGRKTVTPQGDFGKYIQSVLDKKKFSQTEVARRGGLDSGNITNMIGGSKRNPEFLTIKRLAAGLEEPAIRVFAALMDKSEQRDKEYWFDSRLMLIDDILAQLPEIERLRLDAVIKALQYAAMESYKETVGKRRKAIS